MRKIFLMLIGAVAMLAVSCSSPPVDSTSKAGGSFDAASVNTEQIRMDGAARMAKISSGDIDGYLDAYSDDAVWMPPNADDLVGKAIARERMAAALQEATVEVETKTEEQQVLSPEWVLERGLYKLTRSSKASDQPAVDVGTYLTIWGKQSDGSWKIEYDIWHSNRPLSPAD